MKTMFLAALLGGAALFGVAAPAQAGCLTGAAVGGVAGHVVGHHGLLGAAAGCVVGRHESNARRERNDAARSGEYRQGPDRAMYGRDAYRDDERR